MLICQYKILFNIRHLIKDFYSKYAIIQRHMADTNNTNIVTRFAPSPTGFLHVGGLRTALYSYLLAKKSGGRFILRIEDTDRARTVPGGVENILTSLSWAGVNPDEGVILRDGEASESGANGPYTQSHRLEIYKKYADELVAKGNAYYCFCTADRLAQVKEDRQANKLPPGYDGHCKNLSKEEVENKLKNGDNHVIRLAMPDDGVCTFHDLIRGEVSFKYSDVDDQVLLKSDGFPTYHLAVVVDDHHMQVSHVVRGEEWISSTPKHIYLYECLGWTPTLFAHLPLLLNSDRSKLSKRQGDVAVLDYKEKGYLPEALLNFVAFLGWNPGDEREMFTLDELVSEFSLEKVNKAGAVFNIEKLDWYNREYLKKLDDEKLLKYIDTFMPEVARNSVNYKNILPRLMHTLLERISKGSEIAETYTENISYFFEKEKIDEGMLVWKSLKDNPNALDITRGYIAEARAILEGMPVESWDDREAIKGALWPLTEKYGRGEVLWPLRVSLSCRDKSPDPFELCYILGREEVLNRI